MRLAACVVLTVLAFAGPFGARAADGPLPPGWFTSGSQPADYEMGIDPGGGRAGRPCAFIRGRGPGPGGFGTLMQAFDATTTSASACG